MDENSKQMALLKFKGAQEATVCHSLESVVLWISQVSRLALGRCALVFELSHSDVICLHVGMTRMSDRQLQLSRRPPSDTTVHVDSMAGGICPRGCCLSRCYG